MEYGVFQIDNENKLVFRAKFSTKADAINFAKSGVNMVVLEIYL